jgi:hypothetical protein
MRDGPGVGDSVTFTVYYRRSVREVGDSRPFALALAVFPDLTALRRDLTESGGGVLVREIVMPLAVRVRRWTPHQPPEPSKPAAFKAFQSEPHTVCGNSKPG